MKRIVPFLLSLIMLLSLCACGGKPVEGDQDVQGERQIKENLTVTLSVEPTTLNPHAVGQLNAYIVNYCIYDTLLKKDADGNIVPNVAKEYEPIDDTHIRFHLRDDVMFSNGEKLTAEDVLSIRSSALQRVQLQNRPTLPLTARTAILRMNIRS